MMFGNIISPGTAVSEAGATQRNITGVGASYRFHAGRISSASRRVGPSSGCIAVAFVVAVLLPSEGIFCRLRSIRRSVQVLKV